MTDRDRIEQEIRAALETETSAVRLSNRLFQQGTGLFGRLATTPEERRAIIDSELFRTAQRRVSELQRKEVDALSKAAQVIRTELPDGEFILRLDTDPRSGPR